MEATEIMTVPLGEPVLLEELIMFSNVSFALGAATTIEAECEATFVVERWKTNTNKHLKTIGKDQRKPLKFIINVKC